MSTGSSKSPSPGRKNSPESYQSAVKGIEQEKQMVAALKRLSIGHLMNHDPDLPVSDPELHLVLDPDHHDDSTFSGDSLSLSKTPSPQTSDSNTLLGNKELPENLHNYATSQSRRSRVFDDQQFEDASSEPLSEDPIDANLLWVPANMHPEVNPQQFKSHVRNTIDELLERKLSRSKSANRSKRSSLSLSTTDQEQLSHAIARNASAKDQDFAARDRFSNPSLRELSSELEELSKMAGMDSNDAVTLARSLSTSSLGYTEVERLAFDEMGSPTHASPSSNQAELMDFGVEETSPTARKSYGMPNLMMGLPPAFQGYPQRSPHRRDVSPSQQNPQSKQFGGGPRPHRQGDDFALKRSRRLDYRKGPTSSSTQLGSQLQNNKAEKLAELRHNLSGATAPTSSPDFLSVSNSNRLSPRLSMQSINPRSSQILFSYKSTGPTSSPTPSSPRSYQGSPMQGGRDSPYGNAATSSTASLDNQLHPTKYGHHKLSSKQMAKQQIPKHRGQMAPQPEHEMHERSSRVPSRGSGHSKEHHRSTKPQHGPQGQVHHGQRRVSPQGQQGPYGYQNRPQSSRPGPQPQQQMRGAQTPQKSPSMTSIGGHPANQPIMNKSMSAQSLQRRQYMEEESQRNEPHMNSRPLFSKRDKSKELNQNLDLLRNEINEFKESLSKSEPKAEVKPATPVAVDNSQELPDISFDLSSHDVSYEDSLGMEHDVGERKQESISTSPRKPRPEQIVVPEPQVEVERESGRRRVLKDNNLNQILDGPATNEVGYNSSKEQLSREATQLSEESFAKLDQHLKEARNISEERTKLEIENAEISRKLDTFKNHVGTPAADVPGKLTPTVKAETPNLVSIPEDRQERRVSSTNETSVEPTMGAPSKIESKIKKKKSFTALTNKLEPEKKKTGKKTWLWSKDRSVSASQSQDQKSELNVPSRSVSSPEISSNKREAPKQKDEPSGKENVISKLFKKKRSSSMSSERSYEKSSYQFTVAEADEKQDVSVKDSTPRSSFVQSRESAKDLQANQRRSVDESKANEAKVADTRQSDAKLKKKDVKLDESKGGEETVKSRIKNKLKLMGKSHEEKTEPVEEPMPDVNEDEDKEEKKPQSTLEVQEKLKKTIRRTSKANQPIEFTDSAFGFPLPPPSQSTLVMIDYRFPVHVERAIYRLSHLKLANPKRSLREQVLLSNFMYAYLNLVDHTLHLEQQMDQGDESLDQPEPDMDMFAADEADTEFEGDDDLDDGAFDSIRIDLDVQDTQQITV